MFNALPVLTWAATLLGALPLSTNAAEYEERSLESESATVFHATPSESKILEFLDRNGDGLLDATEFGRFPVPMRRWLMQNGFPIDVEPTPVATFGPTMRDMLVDLREGKFSAAARPRTVAAESSERAERVLKPRSSERTDPEWRANADYIFKMMDYDKNGTIDRGEWSKSRTIRPWFEKDGRKFEGEMSREEFLKHLVDIQRRIEAKPED